MSTSTIHRPNVTERAIVSQGGSSSAIHTMVKRAMGERSRAGGALIDIGCGKGDLREHVRSLVDEYIGADVFRYDTFPDDARFIQIDLDGGRVPLPDASAEWVVAVETIEHLENPRAFLRELTRLVKPGGTVLVSTPNQLSLLSLLTLMTKRQFNAFQEAPGLYPAHITALLEIDLLRIAAECRLENPSIRYSDSGRMPFSARQWPPASFRGRLFSDNLLLLATKAAVAA